MTISPRQNPGPLIRPDGSALLLYPADGMNLPSPTCSDEGRAMQLCPADTTKPCDVTNDIVTLEKIHLYLEIVEGTITCYSTLYRSDGVDWSSKPRVGAYDTTVQFTDGTSMKCERRERPQMVLDNNGRLVAFSTALTGCPKGLMSGIGDESSIETNARFYKGGDDSFTLVQRMAV